MKYLLIDGNNMAIRCAFANQDLKNHDDIPTGVHFGMFQSIIGLKKTFGSDYQFFIVWDGKSQRRIKEAQAGVGKGIIKSGYKENRKKDEQPKPLLDFYEQSPFLQRAIGFTGIPQIRLSEYECDDVIASYAQKLKNNNEILIVTSDRDYYQILDNNIQIYDGMKQILHTKLDFVEKFKINPEQYIDVGALMGDSGDNIFGIPGWGETKALEAIQTFGSWTKLFDNYHQQYDKLRIQYPDIVEQETFKKLNDIKTKSGKPKYADIYLGLPFTGVTLAMEEKKIEKTSKDVLMALMFEERVALAYSLKKMDIYIENLPEITKGSIDENKINEYFEYYDITSLQSDIEMLCQ